MAPRRWEREQVDAALAAGTEEASAVHPAWERLDTAHSTIEETVQAVIARPAGGAEVASDVVFPEEHATARVIWITGPRCAGASRVGWELARTQWAAGERTGFLDGEQLSFSWNADPVNEAEAAAVVQAVFAEAGAKALIVVAPFEISPKDVHAAFPRADVRFFRLDADDRTRRGHAVRRAEGADGAVLAGDDLIGADADAIERVLAVGARQRASPLRIGEILVDMPTSTVTQVVDRGAGIGRSGRSARLKRMASYTHGHHESVLRSHNVRDIANSAAYLRPRPHVRDPTPRRRGRPRYHHR